MCCARHPAPVGHMLGRTCIAVACCCSGQGICVTSMAASSTAAMAHSSRGVRAGSRVLAVDQLRLCCACSSKAMAELLNSAPCTRARPVYCVAYQHSVTALLELLGMTTARSQHAQAGEQLLCLGLSAQRRCVRLRVHDAFGFSAVRALASWHRPGASVSASGMEFGKLK